MATEPTQPPFDWQSEQVGQKRDLSRFATELGRVLTFRGSGPAKLAAERLFERWDNLMRRLEGRLARIGEAWVARDDVVAHLTDERRLLRALIEFNDALLRARDVETVLRAAQTAVTTAISCEGALVHLLDMGGRSHRVASEKRRGRNWPAAADRELTDYLVAGVADGTRITIEGRPVGRSSREQGRAAHWLAVGITHDDASHGAIIVGRRAGETPFATGDGDALQRIADRLGRALAARIGVGVRRVLGAGPKPEGFGHMWGESPAFRRALAMAARFALSDSPVVITGELGTGRETLARAMHKRSNRAEEPFVVFRGTDLPEDIAVRQLFGEVEHAGDNTIENPGDLELAGGGTLYIDELVGLDQVVQVRLVRYLNEGTFERVGERRERRATARIVAATSSNLEEAVAGGRVREDLYYLISGARIALPALRERAGDIVELSRRFAVACGKKAGKPIEGIDSDAARVLSQAPFPGNVRQLSKLIERAVFLAGGPLIGAADLPGEIGAPVAAAPMDATAWVEQVSRAIRDAIAAGSSGDFAAFKRARQSGQRALEGAFTASVNKAVGGHPSRAARHLGIHRAQWWRLLQTTEKRPATPGDAENPPSRHDHDEK